MPEAAPSIREALEELDVARFVGDPKRVVAAKAAVAMAKQAAVVTTQSDTERAEAFVEWRNARAQA